MASTLAALQEEIAKIQKQIDQAKATEIAAIKKRHLDELTAAGLNYEEVWGVPKGAKPATKREKGEPKKHYQWTDADGKIQVYKGSRPSEALKASRFYVNGAVNTEGMKPIN